MQTQMDLNFIKLRKNAMVPKKTTSGSAGWDLYACLEENIQLSFGELVKIPCGIAIELPENYTALIFARSGLGTNYGIMPSNAVGVIDSDYRGEIQVGLCRVENNELYTIKNQDRIAQLIIVKIENFNFREVKNISKTERGTRGFGSTGK
ncbi:MAG: dUTP diphosphatase [Oscillospiraceae bacterium]|jgi:dUTP pyrophosphatase|nr:dUTP diphosphatase [Oscillospiraceae bacterium]